jgi:hypothetical protein
VSLKAGPAKKKSGPMEFKMPGCAATRTVKGEVKSSEKQSTVKVSRSEVFFFILFLSFKDQAQSLLMLAFVCVVFQRFYSFLFVFRGLFLRLLWSTFILWFDFLRLFVSTSVVAHDVALILLILANVCVSAFCFVCGFFWPEFILRLDVVRLVVSASALFLHTISYHMLLLCF